MSTTDSSWTNEAILREVMTALVGDIYAWSAQAATAVREAAADENQKRLQDRLVDLQIACLADSLSFVDGARGPSGWLGIRLVNAATGESLAADLRSALSAAEDEYLETEQDGEA